MKSMKVVFLSVVFSINLNLIAVDEESELDFVSTEKAFKMAKENKGWVLLYIDWGR